MGMYTEFHYNAELKRDTPEEVLEILRFMMGDREGYPSLPHELFRCQRWKYMLSSDSYYFDADTHSTLRKDDICNSWYLCIRCNLKNYRGEIEKFCDWIRPYINKVKGEFLGFYRYEEVETPTLIFA